MMPDPPATGPLFKITRQDHQPTFDPNSGSASTWTVHFRTRSGVESFIELPDNQYTAENVATMISERARTIEQVHAIGEGAQ